MIDACSIATQGLFSHSTLSFARRVYFDAETVVNHGSLYMFLIVPPSIWASPPTMLEEVPQIRKKHFPGGGRSVLPERAGAEYLNEKPSFRLILRMPYELYQLVGQFGLRGGSSRSSLLIYKRLLHYQRRLESQNHPAAQYFDANSSQASLKLIQSLLLCPKLP